MVRDSIKPADRDAATGGDDQCRTTPAARQGPGTKGKYADVIAVDGNPLDNISLMKQVSFVIKEGVAYKMNSAPVPVY